MKNINEVLLVGKVKFDVNYTETTNSLVANFSVAVTNHIKTEEGLQTRVDYIRVNAWGKLAEKLKKINLVDGNNVIVQGLISSSVYEKDGVTQTSYTVTANNVDKKNELIYGKHINQVLLHGQTSKIDSEKVKFHEDVETVDVKFSLVTSTFRKNDKKNDWNQEDWIQTDVWHNIILRISKSLYESEFEKRLGTPGGLMTLSGKLKQTSYTDKEWNKKYYTYVLVREDGVLGIYEKSKENEGFKKEASSVSEAKTTAEPDYVDDDEEEVSMADIPF